MNIGELVFPSFSPIKSGCVCVAVLATCLLCPIAVANETGSSSYDSVKPAMSTPSISTVMRTFSDNKPEIYIESWVLVSPHGLRVTDGVSDAEIIKNFSERRVWLQNRKTKLQHEIDLESLSKDFPDLASLTMELGSESNLLGATPCDTWKGTRVGKRIWRGVVVDVFDCTEDSGMIVNRQYFSQRHNVVIRVEHPNSMIEELRNITDMELKPSDFQPDKKFKSVSYTEFTSGEEPLTKYAGN